MNYAENKVEGEVVQKGWGYERILRNGPEYCMKELHVVHGGRCSTHFHPEKVETFLLASGVVDLYLGHPGEHERIQLYPGGCVHIPAGTPHYFTAHRKSVIIEASTIHDDRDVVRLEPGDSQHDGPESEHS